MLLVEPRGIEPLTFALRKRGIRVPLVANNRHRYLNSIGLLDICSQQSTSMRQAAVANWWLDPAPSNQVEEEGVARQLRLVARNGAAIGENESERSPEHCIRRITIPVVKSLGPGEAVWDSDVRGFGVRRQRRDPVYVLKARIAGKQRFLTIGAHGKGWTVESARREAARLLGCWGWSRPARTQRELATR